MRARFDMEDGSCSATFYVEQGLPAWDEVSSLATGREIPAPRSSTALPGGIRRPISGSESGTRTDVLYPVEVVEVPAHGFPQAGREIVARDPSEVALDARAVDGISAIVARAVLHERDQLAILLRVHFLLGGERLEKGVDQVEVAPFVAAPDVVAGARPPPREHQPHGLHVIVHVEPVPDVLTAA